ncbi:MAG: hypothetical protein VXW43_19850, partial [Pseudomonadota bacterium]|nr:hypothetical protein [Pseudomonadota bacterium]
RAVQVKDRYGNGPLEYLGWNRETTPFQRTVAEEARLAIDRADNVNQSLDAVGRVREGSRRPTNASSSRSMTTFSSTNKVHLCASAAEDAGGGDMHLRLLEGLYEFRARVDYLVRGAARRTVLRTEEVSRAFYVRREYESCLGRCPDRGAAPRVKAIAPSTACRTSSTTSSGASRRPS